MKPWLLNILACPIDKHHPLEVYFFRWETSENEVKDTEAKAGKPQKELEEKYRILRKQLGDGTISPPSIAIIMDLTGSKAATSLQTKAMMLLRGKPESNEELDVIYRYLNTLEVGEGLFVCPTCGRWYPIGRSVESIPELMPDELRKREEELEWLRKWSSVIPSNILEGVKPYKSD